MSAVSPCFNFKLQQLKNWIVNAKQYNRPRGLLDPPHSTRMTTKSSVLGGLKRGLVVAKYNLSNLLLAYLIS